MILAIDTETTGLDFRHGTRPFLVTTCDDEGNQTFWEWDVDPLTRKPIIPNSDLGEIQETINEADTLVLQNAKFDVAALATIMPNNWKWNWAKTYDTLLAGHLLASNQPHDLTTMVLIYLGTNVQPYEDKIKKACNEARRICRSQYPDWQIAKKGRKDMPSAKEKTWKDDMWLPCALAKDQELPKDHKWWTLCSEYANVDSVTTMALFLEQRKRLKKQDLWNIYLERLKIMPIVYDMEKRGVTLSGKRLEKQYKEYQEESDSAGRLCTNIAKSFNYELTLPKSGNNKSLSTFIFDVMKLEPYKKSKKTGAPSMDAEVMAYYAENLAGPSREKLFIDRLAAKRKRDTALAYMEGYKRFWLPLSRPITIDIQQKMSEVFRITNSSGSEYSKEHKIYYKKVLDSKVTLDDLREDLKLKNNELERIRKSLDWYKSSVRIVGAKRRLLKQREAKLKLETEVLASISFCANGSYKPDWYVIHPSLNPTGTATLRWSSKNPNEQNISAKEDFNLRYSFGPAPGREWWALDYDNLELKIPAYECGETEMIQLFERPDEAPFFGSYHLFVASILHPQKWKQCLKDGVSFKKKYPVLYGRTKNGNFANQYGAIVREDGWGMADRAYGVRYGQSKVQARLNRITGLNKRMIALANKQGYVETIPDKDVDPKRGYPLWCTRTNWGGISPTIPLNYHVQGTACWIMMRAMLKVQDYLDQLNKKAPDYFMVLQVHDEIVVDFPQKKERGNLPKIKRVRKLMESIGDSVGVPLTCGIDYHKSNWSESE